MKKPLNIKPGKKSDDEIAYDALEMALEAELTSTAPEVVKTSDKVATTFIAEGTVIEGNVRTDGNLELCGVVTGDIDVKGRALVQSTVNGNIAAYSAELISSKFTGNITVANKVIVDEDTFVKGDIYAEDAIICGKVEGKLDVKKNISFESKAVVAGDIKTGTMTMACGAIIKGNIEMSGNK